jgi:thiol-disulfide isomerase/thioredoxin
MRKILLLTVVMLLSFGSYAQQGVKWETGTFEQSLKKAQKANKMIFMDCFTSWCGPCKWMSENVFSTKEAGDYFNKNFVCVKFDMEKGEGTELKARYGVQVFPTFLIIGTDGNEVGRLVGKNELKPFINFVEIAKDKERSPLALEQKLKESGNIQYAYDYIDVMTKLDMHDYTGFIFNKYWDKIDKYGKFNRKNVIYFPRAIQLKTPLVFFDILDNKAEYDRHFGKEVINKVLVDGLSEEFYYFFATKTYNAETISAEAMEKACNVMKMLASDDAYAQFMTIAAKAKYSGNNDEFIKYLDVQNLSSFCTFRQLMQVRMMMNNFEIPEEVKAKFIRDLRAFYEEQLKSTDKDWEKYK